MSRHLSHILTAISAALLLSFSGMLTGCRSSKGAAAHRPASSASKPHKKSEYDAMRRELSALKFDNKLIDNLITEAGRWIGTPYRYGGAERSGADCSGFVMKVFDRSLGEKLPRSSREQRDYCRKINRGELLPGDLLFFATGSNRNRVSHVGLYIGNNEIIHASTSRGVIVSDLRSKYWREHYHSSGRPVCIQRIYTAAVNPANMLREQQAMPEMTTSATPEPDTELDEIITQQCDSIFNGFFD